MSSLLVSSTAYQPLSSFPSSSKTTLQDLEALISPSSSSQTRPPIPSSVFRSLTRSSQVSLNASKERVKQAKHEVEVEDARWRVVQKERRGVCKVRDELENEQLVEATDLLPIEVFHQLASEELKGTIPSDDDEEYEQALLYARLRFEQEQIAEREQTYASLQKQLAATKLETDILKKKSIEADIALEELGKVADKVAKSLDEVANLL